MKIFPVKSEYIVACSGQFVKSTGLQCVTAAMLILGVIGLSSGWLMWVILVMLGEVQVTNVGNDSNARGCNARPHGCVICQDRFFFYSGIIQVYFMNSINLRI